MSTPALPYPLSTDIHVFQDDGLWPNYRAWFMRRDVDLHRLHVVDIKLAHYDCDPDEPIYTSEEWARKADELVAAYPDCIFIYLNTQSTPVESEVRA